MAFGYLLDIDGTITTRYGVDSPVDRKVIERFPRMHGRGEAIALVTGRSEWWLDEKVVPVLAEYDMSDHVLVLGEYIYLKIWKGEKYWDPKALEFEKAHRDRLKETIADLAKAHGVETKLADVRRAPKAGELWFEPSRGVLSVRTNPYNQKVDADFVYSVSFGAARRLGLKEFETKRTTISTAISRMDANKENSARLALKLLDPENRVEKWYAFGDSEMDERMKHASDKIIFVPVKEASRSVLNFLDKLEQLKR